MSRFSLKRATPQDLPELEAIERECEAYFAFDPPGPLNHSASLAQCLTRGDPPPGVPAEDYRRENYFLCCIRRDGTLIGFASYYTAYREPDAAYLSTVYIREADRNKGTGSALVAILEGKCADAGYRSIHLHCSLRNAQALRFWVRHGFDRIVDVECDGNLYPGNFGGVELRKDI